ncbi:beta-lactamase [Paramyrothecium foliicola]|nr:beta-lactamase [Paramyrothecium foliicola]
MAAVISKATALRMQSIIDEYTSGSSTDNRIPGLMYVGFRGTGDPIFEHYSGTRGISSPLPMDDETIFWMASFTKIATSIACMQLVEQGKITLDDASQIEALAPRLRDVKVLTGNAKDGYKLVEKIRPITLRMLLNHTASLFSAGFGYAFEDQRLADFGRPVGFEDFCSEAIDFFKRPLLNQPGEKFQYGTSMDWVGVLVERISGLSLEDYFKKHIFEPLGVQDVSFFPSMDLKENLAFLHERARNGQLSQIDHLCPACSVSAFLSHTRQSFEMVDSETAQRDASFQELVSLLRQVPKSNFDPFNIYRTQYTSAGSKIDADILVPASIPKRTPCPVIVTGSSLFPAWFSKWILDFAEEQSAVIISPNYRLLPEVKGKDILEDMRCFWQWFDAGGCQKYLNSIGLNDIELDIDRLLLLGESAGGYLVIQSVLSQFARPRAIVMLYPMIDLKADHYTKESEKPIVGVPNFPSQMVDEFLASANGQAPITEADPPDRLAVALASVQTGRFLEFLGEEPELFILDRIQTNNLPQKKSIGPLLPPFFILHGKEDSAVPANGTLRFLETLREKHSAVRFRVAIQPGDHGFDFGATLDDSWLRNGLNFVTSPWHGDKGRM